MTSLRLAYLSLLRRRFPTFITVMAIALSVGCSGILLRLYKLSESRFSSMGSGVDAIVGAKAGGIEILLGSLNGEGEYPKFLPYKLFESLKAEQTVHFEDGITVKPNYISSVTPFVYFGLFHNFRLAGTDESFVQRGIHFAEGHWSANPEEVVVGSSVARIQKIKLNDMIRVKPWVGKEIESNEMELKVVGILQPTLTMWDHMLYSNVQEAHRQFEIHNSALRESSIWGPYVLNYFLVNLNAEGFNPLEALINSRTVGQVVRVAEQKARLEELTGVGRSIGLFVSVFVILLGGLSVCAMLVTRFDAMNIQLAVLRALGYSKFEISNWLIWEGFFLGLMGCFLGGVLDFIGMPLLRGLLTQALPPEDIAQSPLWTSYPIWFIAIFATVVSVLVPLIRLYRQDVHSALRQV